MEIYIYTLSHPITNEVRYVGKTINIKRRYKQHLYDKRTSHKSSWVQSLRTDKLKPTLTIIETCTPDNWKDREIYWITQFNNLTNLKLGGDDGNHRIIKNETIEKIKTKLTGRKLSEEHKNNIIQSTKNKRGVIIDGIKYYSIMDASKKLLIPKSTVHKRVNANSFPNFYYE